ncbi:hypothetical protein ACNUDN_21345 [Mycobacterium sp. smrl_JER01]|uniref:hypothetical protein n=1 Tax=Mycobacterium sp. smrl_JER01 TaxID=3402633 RepID=UPI003AC11E1B
MDNKTEDPGSQAESSGHEGAGSLPTESAGSWQDTLVPEGTAEKSANPDAASRSPLEAMLGEGKSAEDQKPSSLDEALTEVAGKPVEAPPTALERIVNQHAGNGKGEERRYTQHPLEAPVVGADPSVIGDQQARVDAAHESVASAQAALDDALAQSTVAGAGAGPTRDQLDALGHALFDARGEVTSQTEILENLNAAAGEVGQGRVPIPSLPENADVQAFPAEPSAFAEGSRALSEGSFGLIPDVAHDIDVFQNWSEASVEDRVGAVLDVAGAAPIPGGKFVTEGLEHAVDAFNAGRHVDDALDAGSAATHHLPYVPSAPHIDVGANQGVDVPLGSSHFSDVFAPVELDIAHAAQDVYSSPVMDDIRQAAQNGVAAEVEIDGYKVLYEPDIPGSGFSLASFGERGFAIGPEAMASEAELARTVAHELYRVSMTEIPELGIDATRAASETEAAFDFAQRFGNAIQGGG